MVAARLPLILLLAVATTSLPAQSSVTSPDSATVAAGKKLFEGAGLCFSCHGMKGEGLLGPTTTLNAEKTKWLHHDGTWNSIAKLITGGVDATASTSGQLMPPRGGSNLTETQVRQVAAYVLTLHRTQPK